MSGLFPTGHKSHVCAAPHQLGSITRADVPPKHLPGFVLKPSSWTSSARLILFVVSSIFSNLIGGSGSARQNISCHVSVWNQKRRMTSYGDFTCYMYAPQAGLKKHDISDLSKIKCKCIWWHHGCNIIKRGRTILERKRILSRVQDNICKTVLLFRL